MANPIIKTSWNESKIDELKEFLYESPGLSFIAYHLKEDNQLAFVLNTTENQYCVFKKLIIDALPYEEDKFEPKIKWDQIVKDKFKINPISIRPKNGNKYEKFDIDYIGLADYEKLIKNPEDEKLRNKIIIDNIKMNLIASRKRQDAATTELNTSSKTIDSTSKTCEKLDTSVKKLKNKLERLNSELETEEIQEEKAITTDKLYKKLTAQKNAKRRLKRAKNRYSDANEILEETKTTIDNILKFLSNLGISVDNLEENIIKDINIHKNEEKSEKKPDFDKNILALKNEQNKMQINKDITREEDRRNIMVQNNITDNKKPNDSVKNITLPSSVQNFLKNGSFKATDSDNKEKMNNNTNIQNKPNVENKTFVNKVENNKGANMPSMNNTPNAQSLKTQQQSTVVDKTKIVTANNTPVFQQQKNNTQQPMQSQIITTKTTEKTTINTPSANVSAQQNSVVIKPKPVVFEAKKTNFSSNSNNFNNDDKADFQRKAGILIAIVMLLAIVGAAGYIFFTTPSMENKDYYAKDNNIQNTYNNPQTVQNEEPVIMPKTEEVNNNSYAEFDKQNANTPSMDNTYTDNSNNSNMNSSISTTSSTRTEQNTVKKEEIVKTNESIAKKEDTFTTEVIKPLPAEEKNYTNVQSDPLYMGIDTTNTYELSNEAIRIKNDANLINIRKDYIEKVIGYDGRINKSLDIMMTLGEAFVAQNDEVINKYIQEVYAMNEYWNSFRDATMNAYYKSSTQLKDVVYADKELYDMYVEDELLLRKYADAHQNLFLIVRYMLDNYAGHVDQKLFDKIDLLSKTPENIGYPKEKTLLILAAYAQIKGKEANYNPADLRLLTNKEVNQIVNDVNINNGEAEIISTTKTVILTNPNNPDDKIEAEVSLEDMVAGEEYEIRMDVEKQNEYGDNISDKEAVINENTEIIIDTSAKNEDYKDTNNLNNNTSYNNEIYPVGETYNNDNYYQYGSNTQNSSLNNNSYDNSDSVDVVKEDTKNKINSLNPEDKGLLVMAPAL